MKKINYFGKEYTVSDDIKWVATNSYGTVMAYTYEPIQADCGWVGGVFYPLDRLPAANLNWENSLRNVEDILVKENELKIGDKVMVNSDVWGFKKGQIVEVYKLCEDGSNLFKGDNSEFKFCDGEGGAHLWGCEYTIIEDTSTPSCHPHADLILKYAMIAQYDPEPWKYFECATPNDGKWFDMLTAGFHTAFKYRLKPQPPVVQVGQIWVSEEGTDVMVDTPSDINTIYFKYQLGGLLIKNAVSLTHFIKHFKRKE